jgi:predicted nucleotide-binding protein (sugar kinase/HSP70/actin superfamily)
VPLEYELEVCLQAPKTEGRDKMAVFTEEMKKTHTILAPTMLPIHFGIIKGVFETYGYHVVFYGEDQKEIVAAGLKNVHNDMCFPALIVIGQFIAALESGEYDKNKVALMLTQTGGGCRASNYIHILRRALEDKGLGHIPVISLNLQQLESHPGFKLTPSLLAKAVYSIYYGDLIMHLYNQCRPYELNHGDAQKVVDQWTTHLAKISHTRSFFQSNKQYKRITKDFAAIEMRKQEKVKVGIVGEIYMKFSPLGNNHLEEFLLSEGAEVVMSGLGDFLMYCLNNPSVDASLYGMKGLGTHLSKFGYWFMGNEQKKMIKAIQKEGTFRAPTPFEEVKKMPEGYVGLGNKMGEGWLLTAEMLELIHSGVNNIVCTQPFGCLPNHIVGKGMVRKIKENHPLSNIVAIDYDPSATKVNQENRIKLMLANAYLNKELEDASPEQAKQSETIEKEIQDYKEKVELPTSGTSDTINF